jgi:DNA-binding CsgD family transcriptional regulator
MMPTEPDRPTISDDDIGEDELLAALGELAHLCAGRPDPVSFASALVLHVLRPFQARSAAVGIVDAQGYVDVRTMYGMPTAVLRDGPRYEITDSFPITDAVRRGDVVHGTMAELTERYPALEPLEIRGEHLLAHPLLFRGATIGGLVVVSDVSPRYEENPVFWHAVADLVSATIATDETAAPRSRHRRSGPLNPRQREILAHMQQGRTNAQIARAMNFGTSTIGHEIMRIFDVFAVASRREAVAAAERAGVLSTPGSDDAGQADDREVKGLLDQDDHRVD